MPVTRTVSISSLDGAAAASGESAAACFASARDTAAAIRLDFLRYIRTPRTRFSCRPLWSQYSTNAVKKTSLLNTTCHKNPILSNKQKLISVLHSHTFLNGIALVLFKWHGQHTSGGERLAYSFAGLATAR